MEFCGVSYLSGKRTEKREAKINRVAAMAALTMLMLILSSAPLWAQSPSFTDFSSAANLTLNGNAVAPVNIGSEESPVNVLRLNPADFSQHGSAWYNVEQPLTGGFTSVFTFQISNTSNPDLQQYFPADGIAFVIQGVLPSAPGGGLTALGGGGGQIGYQGIPNSLAIEFDTFFNGPDSNNDPNANHVGVQSCGSQPNSADHLATNGNLSCNLGLTSPQINLADGQTHTVTVNYRLAAPGCEIPCTPNLFVNLDGTELFPNGIAVDLSTRLTLDNGKGLVGFTSATGALIENNDILSWTFTPNAVPQTVTQTINPGVTSVFAFGAFNYKITPDTVTNSGPDTLTVTAIPVDPSQFNPGPNFPGAHCIPYGSNNGKCTEFQVTCSGPDCTTGTYQLALNWDDAGTGPNDNPGLLDAPDQACPPPANHPFSTNIFTDYQETRQDPVVKGAGGPRYSCFVAVKDVNYGKADLVVLNVASTKAKVGTTLSYAIGLTNLGPATANKVVVTDQLDPNTTFVNGSVAQTTCTFLLHGLTCTKPVPVACTASGQVVTCPVGVLAATTSLQVVTAAAAVVNVSINPTACSGNTCTTLRNTATVVAVNPDPKPKTNTSTATTQVTKK